MLLQVGNDAVEYALIAVKLDFENADAKCEHPGIEKDTR